MTTWLLILTLASSEGAIHSIEFGTEQRCREAGQAWADDLRKSERAPGGKVATRFTWICMPK